MHPAGSTHVAICLLSLTLTEYLSTARVDMGQGLKTSSAVHRGALLELYCSKPIQDGVLKEKRGQARDRMRVDRSHSACNTGVGRYDTPGPVVRGEDFSLLTFGASAASRMRSWADTSRTGRKERWVLTCLPPYRKTRDTKE